MAEFLSGDSIWVYIVIFIGKIIEISLDVVRIVLINRGQKTLGAAIGFVVIMIWLFIASSVLNAIQTNIFKGLVYALAYSLGNYFGVVLDKKLAIGLCSMQVIVKNEDGYLLINLLRENGFGVTVLEGEGFDFKRNILVLHFQRKRIEEAKKIIFEVAPDAVLTVSDVSEVTGGFMKKIAKRMR